MYSNNIAAIINKSLSFHEAHSGQQRVSLLQLHSLPSKQERYQIRRLDLMCLLVFDGAAASSKLEPGWKRRHRQGRRLRTRANVCVDAYVAVD